MPMTYLALHLGTIGKYDYLMVPCNIYSAIATDLAIGLECQ